MVRVRRKRAHYIYPTVKVGFHDDNLHPHIFPTPTVVMVTDILVS